MSSLARLLALVVICTAAVSTSARAATEGTWRQHMENALRATLVARWPQVQAWSMRPLLTNRQQAQFDRWEVKSAAVTHIGARSAVRITATTSRGQAAAATVWFAVAGDTQALSATSALSAGTVLSRQDLALRTQDVMALSCNTSPAPQSLLDMRLKRAIRAGEALCTSDVEPAPLVQRGEMVTVRAIAGAVMLTTRAVAQRDGRLGAVLPVRNMASGATFEAAVTGPAEVTVQ